MDNKRWLNANGGSGPFKESLLPPFSLEVTLMAIGALKALTDSGLKVPDDIAIF